MSAVLNVVSVSGGKDSTALYCWAIDRFGPEGFRAVFADTGNEHPVTLNYVRNLHRMAGGPCVEWVEADFVERLKHKMTVADPSESEYVNRVREVNRADLERSGWTTKKAHAHGGAFLDMMLWKGRAPSSKAQFCTDFTKLKPIGIWLELVRGDADVNMFVGIRAGESERRSKMPEREWSDLFDCEVVRPLIQWSEEQVFELLRQKGVPPNPLYEAGFARVGCYPCIHARKVELAQLEEWAWDKLREWERRLGRSWFPAGLIPGVEVPTIDQVREWSKTSRGGRQIDMFAPDAKDVPTCMATWGACE